MKILNNLLSYPTRWRRSRGFGIHSPFAYNFITKVLREREAEYYAYAEIAAFCPRARRAGFNEIFAGKDMSIPEAQLLFRVLCHFNPSEIIEIGHGHEVTNVILERAVPHTKVIQWHPGKIIHPSGDMPFILINQMPRGELDAIRRLIFQPLSEQDVVIMVRNLNVISDNKHIWHELLTVPTFGMGFSDHYMGIYVGYHALPHQNYQIIL